ncbi:hypothetical protein [Fibrobacter sp. UWB12]|uniref:hypothetical protein n=1 Tax=Fibrobacter sp. UWB12 TaxID=1896203 RepID=UPI00091BAA8B|nr:hypothetical protein [Fibrobacter sp. UWB12]SHK26570.1 hypothetical protein SAMN05720759_101419 [Fibrobacter sp. UWB12]
MSKRVLFVAPKYMDLYKDIIAEMERQGYEVDYIPEQSYKDDPLNIRGYSRFSKRLVSPAKFSIKINDIWLKKLNSEEFSKSYDYGLILDGQSLSPVFFEVLKKRNPKIKFVNYLFDSTTGVYHFEQNFKYFDNVYTFDIKEAQIYKIGLLPIYWTDCENVDCPRYQFFGLGAIKNDRYELFKMIESIAVKKNMTYYLKLYDFVKTKNMILYKIRYALYKLIGLKEIISPKALQSHFVTRDSMPPEKFRKHIAGCDVVVDTSAPYQDGLTARFMWSVGLGKRIITTNTKVAQYDFFDKNQILVCTMTTSAKDIEDFCNTKFAMNDEIRKKLLDYRLDNWVCKLLE